MAQYLIYRITSPSGRCYVGMTHQSLSKRWSQHKALAKKGKKHPFYNAIRKHGPENFIVEIIDTADDVETAKELEMKYIASENTYYNISIGGDYDTVAATSIMWSSLRADPQAYESYRRKVSESTKQYAIEHPDKIEKLRAGVRKWRADNPREAWKQESRALRIARAKNNRKAKPIEDRPLTKMELLAKHNPTKAHSERAKQGWRNMSDATKDSVRQKLSALTTQHMATLSTEERRERTSKARQHLNNLTQEEKETINRNIGKGVSAFWENLRKDPVAYEEYKKKKREKFRETRKSNENLRHT